MAQLKKHASKSKTVWFFVGTAIYGGVQALAGIDFSMYLSPDWALVATSTIGLILRLITNSGVFIKK